MTITNELPTITYDVVDTNTIRDWLSGQGLDVTTITIVDANTFIVNVFETMRYSIDEAAQRVWLALGGDRDAIDVIDMCRVWREYGETRRNYKHEITVRVNVDAIVVKSDGMINLGSFEIRI